MKLAIEGMDGVGKSTIGKALAKEYNLMYIDKPLHYFFEDSEENGYADLMAVAKRVYDIKDSAIRAWFIGMGNVLCFRKFKDIDFIVDRHFVSNYFWNGDEESKKVYKAMIDIIGVPDLTILLYATPKTRMERIRLRDANDKDLSDSEKMEDGFQKMLKFVLEFQLPHICVDTENKTVDEIMNEITHYINHLQKENYSRQLKKESKNE